nr:ribonuclease H-like domain-containing protein [Tanacetum cinerariifolium]
MKGIKREFSVTKTSQQNGVAKRKNKTLIEAVRTMLVDFKLPTTFWAEAVNTACYVLNRALVIKPRTKDNIVAGQAEKKKEPKQEYILIPICTIDPLIFQGHKNSAVDTGKKATEVDASQV